METDLLAASENCQGGGVGGGGWGRWQKSSGYIVTVPPLALSSMCLCHESATCSLCNERHITLVVPSLCVCNESATCSLCNERRITLVVSSLCVCVS